MLVEAGGVTAELDEANSSVKVIVPTNLPEKAYVMVKAVRNSDGKYSAQYITISKIDPYGTFGGVIVVDEEEYLNW